MGESKQGEQWCGGELRGRKESGSEDREREREREEVHCKWSKHIDVLIERTSKQLFILRKRKYRLKRDYLEKIYLVFIRLFWNMHQKFGIIVDKQTVIV